MRRLTSVHYISFLLIVLSLLLQAVYYLKTQQFDSPIIAFEFAKTEIDIIDLFTINESVQKEIVEGVDYQNWIDFLYLSAYSTLLFFTFNRLRKYEYRGMNTIGIALSVIAFLFDILENTVLLKITNALVHGDNYKYLIELLIVFTNIKWFSLALIFGFLSLHYYKLKGAGKLFSVLSALPLLLAFPSFFSLNPEYDNYYAYSVMLGFIILIIRIFVSKFAGNSYRFYKEISLKNDSNPSYGK